MTAIGGRVRGPRLDQRPALPRGPLPPHQRLRDRPDQHQRRRAPSRRPRRRRHRPRRPGPRRRPPTSGATRFTGTLAAGSLHPHHPGRQLPRHQRHRQPGRVPRRFSLVGTASALGATRQRQPAHAPPTSTAAAGSTSPSPAPRPTRSSTAPARVHRSPAPAGDPSPWSARRCGSAPPTSTATSSSATPRHAGTLTFTVAARWTKTSGDGPVAPGRWRPPPATTDGPSSHAHLARRRLHPRRQATVDRRRRRRARPDHRPDHRRHRRTRRVARSADERPTATCSPATWRRAAVTVTVWPAPGATPTATPAPAAPPASP